MDIKDRDNYIFSFVQGYDDTTFSCLVSISQVRRIV